MQVQNKPDVKIMVMITVYEKDGRPIVQHDIQENDVRMKDVALLLYKMKQIEQSLIDRIWNNSGEGYEIEY